MNRYAEAGVDIAQADEGLAGLIDVLAKINPGRPAMSVVDSGHYASVLRIAGDQGVAIATDGVGSKVLIAQELDRFDTIGIDCVAMNVNDLICVGATPIAMVDYLAVECPDRRMLKEIAIGLRAGAEAAGIEIPGGELAQIPEVIRGTGSGKGFDLAGTAIGTVSLDAIVGGERIAPGDAIVGMPAGGIHSNGLTLARQALFQSADMSVSDRPATLDCTLGEELLKPTVIYVRAVLELLRSPTPVNGLAHITGGGIDNLRRLNSSVAFEIDNPLPEPPIFALIQSAGDISNAEMTKVFNLGLGFCCIVPAPHADSTVELLARRHPGTRVVGSVTAGGPVGHVR